MGGEPSKPESAVDSTDPLRSTAASFWSVGTSKSALKTAGVLRFEGIDDRAGERGGSPAVAVSMSVCFAGVDLKQSKSKGAVSEVRFPSLDFSRKARGEVRPLYKNPSFQVLGLANSIRAGQKSWLAQAALVAVLGSRALVLLSTLRYLRLRSRVMIAPRVCAGRWRSLCV